MPKTIAPGFVKICGVTSLDDAKVVVDAGASALGLVLAASPRQLTLDQARVIADATTGNLLRFAVFRHNDDEFILEHVDALRPDVVQVHGTLSVSLLRALRERPVLVVKALSVDEPEFLTFDDTRVEAVLIDGPRPGSGSTYSRDHLERREFHVPVIAAGGLTARNVADLIDASRVSGVDTSSGVEKGPGAKDHDLVREFIVTARAAFAARKD
ncbi:MAG: N-(5-phosphoribosyl)anthranilate isomerase [Acidimicrobiaceae bacterium]|nr:N-(5-phosphoribosyl)anthranilate isomerase [Acidimicrobiaceae bacterium]